MRSILLKTLPGILVASVAFSASPIMAQTATMGDPNPTWQRYADGSTTGWQGDQPQPDVNAPAHNPNGVPPDQGWQPGQHPGMGMHDGQPGWHHDDQGPWHRDHGYSNHERPQGGAMHVHHQGDVTFVSGGVGLDESRALLAEGRHYPLMLTFLGNDREYLSDVRVKVVSSRGDEVLMTRSEGPYLLANLPSGRYTVHVTYHGREQVRRIAISASGHVRSTFTWPTHDD